MEHSQIKKDTLKRLFGALCSEVSLSRAALSEKCSLSVMTVGKAVDLLTELGLVSQRLAASDGTGRRARRAEIKKDRYICIYSLTRESFTMELCELNGKVQMTCRRHVASQLDYERELYTFCHDALTQIATRFKSEKLIGCGVIAQGKRGGNDKSFDIDIRSVILSLPKDIFPGNIFTVSTGAECSLLDYSEKAENGSKCLALLCNNGLHTCYFVGGDTEFRVKNCGKLPYNESTDLITYLKSCRDPQTVADIIAELIFFAVSMVHTDKVILSSSIYSNADLFNGLVRERLALMCDKSSSQMPKVECDSTFSASTNGMRIRILREWFDKEISKLY